MTICVCFILILWCFKKSFSMAEKTPRRSSIGDPEKAKLQFEVQALELKNIQLMEELQQKKQEITQVENEKLALVKKGVIDRQDTNKLRNDVQQREYELETELEQKELEIQNLETSKAQLMERIEELKVDLTTKDTELTTLQMETSVASQKVLEQKTREIEEKTAELIKAQNDLSATKKELEQSRKTCTAVRQFQSQAEAEVNAHRNLDNKLRDILRKRSKPKIELPAPLLDSDLFSEPMDERKLLVHSPETLEDGLQNLTCKMTKNSNKKYQFLDTGPPRFKKRRSGPIDIAARVYDLKDLETAITIKKDKCREILTEGLDWVEKHIQMENENAGMVTNLKHCMNTLTYATHRIQPDKPTYAETMKKILNMADRSKSVTSS